MPDKPGESDNLTNAPEWITPRAAAVLMGVDIRTLARWADAGTLDSITLPGGHRRYSKPQIDAIRRAVAK